MSCRVALVIAIATLALAVPDARAATIAFPIGLDSNPYRAPTLTAGPGEVNRVTFEIAGQTLTARDAGAPLQAGNGCVAVDAATVTCTVVEPGRTLFGARAVLGDGDDTATVTGGPMFADGGPGNDVLTGGPAADTLNGGGGGTDTLVGGGGGDELTDGDTDADADGDVLDGGGGASVIYRARQDDLVIDLQGERPNGASGEGDRLSGIADVLGGSGDDWFRGDDGPNQLSGEGGDDELRGGAGDDRLYGGGGDDDLRGSVGDDTLEPSSGRDELSCGLGADVVGHPEAGEVMSTNCERATYLLYIDDEDVYWSVRPTPRTVGRSTIDWGFGCPPSGDDEDDPPARCRIGLVVREARGDRRLLGRGQVTGPAGGKGTRATVSLTPLGRALSGRRRGVKATVVASGRRRDNAPNGRSWSFVLSR